MLEFACKVFKVFTSLRSKKFKTFDTLKTLCSCKLDLENIYDTSARSETQNLHSFYKMLQHSPTFRWWKGIRTNAEDFKYMEDITLQRLQNPFNT